MDQPSSQNFALSTPVAFILFNRPEKTAQAFATIAEAKPSRLFLIADGPRENHPTDAANCAAARAVVEKIEWDCTVYHNYSEQNLGCKRRVSSGIDWVFEQAEEAIIIEDDVLVATTFFRFAQEMLAYYRDDRRIMSIAGMNPIAPLRDYPYSYFLGVWPLIWGWATWRRAWQTYDVTMSAWSPEVRTMIEQLPFFDTLLMNVFEQLYQGNIDTWDLQWLFANILQSGLTVIPGVNMVQNVGFGPDATHTKTRAPRHATKIPSVMEFPLRHPPYKMVHTVYQERIISRIHQQPLVKKVLSRLDILLSDFQAGRAS